MLYIDLRLVYSLHVIFDSANRLKSYLSDVAAGQAYSLCLTNVFFILYCGNRVISFHPITCVPRPTLPLNSSPTGVTFSTTAMSSGFYSLKAELPNGNMYDFADLQGKTVLIVNVASKW